MMPAERVRTLNSAPTHPEREWVLYWMTSFRRFGSNFAIERAIDHARKLQRPLLVLEPLRAAYPNGNARLHTFVLEGMADNWRRAQSLRGAGIHHADWEYSGCAEKQRPSSEGRPLRA